MTAMPRDRDFKKIVRRCMSRSPSGDWSRREGRTAAASVTLAPAVLSDAWEAEAEQWVTWARKPGHDSYWTFHRDAFLTILPRPGRLTLDVGCGEGRLGRDLTRLGHRVIGVDRSTTLAQYAAAAGGTIGTVLADGAHLPFRDEAVDLAIAFMSLQDMDDMPRCVQELARVLEPGGRLCLAITHPLNSARTIGASGQGDSWVIDAGAYWTTRRLTDTEERDGLCMTFHAQHRPMEAYFEALDGAGLLTETIREPRGTGAISSYFPFFLHIRARRP
jgi:SAM-dependent methyltransferase